MRSGTAPIPAREEIKELIGLGLHVNPAPSPHTDARWQHLLDLLVQEFLIRRHEVSRLDKTRREDRNRSQACIRNRLIPDGILDSKVGSRENEGLLIFAHELALFHLLQILLAKRLHDLNLIKAQPLNPANGTINWLLSRYIKSHSGRKVQGKDDWTFTKQNLYSWFAPSSDSWERIRLSLESASLTEVSDPGSIFNSIESHTRLGISRVREGGLPFASGWKMLLETKRVDLGASSFSEAFPTRPSHDAFLAFGMGSSHATVGLRSIFGLQNIPLWLAPSSELEQFLTEITLLWTAPGRLPSARTYRLFAGITPPLPPVRFSNQW